MRPRLVVLLVLLATAISAAVVVQRRRTRAADLDARMTTAARRYLAMEAEAAAREESTWATTQPLRAADQWMATTLDTVQSAPDPWSAWTGFLPRWPGLADLARTSAGYQQSGWTWERLTGRPAPTSRESLMAGRCDFDWELLLSRGDERAVIRARVAHQGPAATPASAEPAEPTRLELVHLTQASAKARFRVAQEFTLDLPRHTFFADPLLHHETPAGPELLLVSTRQRFQFRTAADGSRRWQAGPLLTGIPADHALAAALADVNGDGWPDLWLGGRDGLWIALGDAHGDFAPPVLRWRSPEPLVHPECLAIADIDQDGDLDVWLAQYKNPYQKGQFPTPYHDADDGFPSYLLRQDGDHGFTDITASSGLAHRRHRRTYSASWVDVDGDGAPDLVNVSDFAGLDVHRNLGGGRFTDLTPALGDDRQAFGMAHVVIDRNGDALPDLLVVGMDSAWAARLDVLGLGHPDFPEHTRHRRAMTQGNRIFLGTPQGLRSEPAATTGGLAHAGWAWGVAELDVENDGRPDYFFANGHETRASQRDYERQFWIHDIHAAGSTNDPAAELFFQSAAARRASEKASYGGWQHQALLQDTGADGSVDVAWLSGVGILADGRNALAADFDGDGRMDLAVTTVEGWPQVRQRLVILRNETPQPGNWIGVRLPPGPGHRDGVNARVEVHTTSGVRRRWLVTGDGYRSQQTSQAHFGIGSATEVASLVVAWTDGRRSVLTQPAINRWHEPPSPTPSR